MVCKYKKRFSDNVAFPIKKIYLFFLRNLFTKIGTLFISLHIISMKNMYIISGCNGAGKTPAAFYMLPEMLECKEFVNLDEIARGLNPLNPDSVA